MSLGEGTQPFSGKAVLLVGAGCVLGTVLARVYAQQGARVILMDRDETRIRKVAAQLSLKVETLAMHCFDAAKRRHFAEIWADEPLAGLIHLQAVRYPEEEGAAISSVVAFTEALFPALLRGRGRVLICHQGGAGRPLAQRAFDPAWEELPRLLDEGLPARPGGAVTVNGLRLPRIRAGELPVRQVSEAARMLTLPEPTRVSGSLLQLDTGRDRKER